MSYLLSGIWYQVSYIEHQDLARCLRLHLHLHLYLRLYLRLYLYLHLYLHVYLQVYLYLWCLVLLGSALE